MKELLEKYWNELEHYKNGGKLAGRRWVIDPNDGDSSFTIWYEIDSCSTWMMKDLLTNPQDRLELIINDEYSIYRKALAEGKIVQYLGQYSNMWHEVQEPDFNLHPTCYRIKPDESKFKVGDFVRYVHSTTAIALEINNINGNRYYFTNSEMSCLKHELELWIPVKGEWCWFWDKCTPHRPTLRQYDIFPEGYGEENMFHDSEQNPFDFCEPFLNSQPSHLKD